MFLRLLVYIVVLVLLVCLYPFSVHVVATFSGTGTVGKSYSHVHEGYGHVTPGQCS